MQPDLKPFYSVEEIAEMFMVKPFTVREWINSGKLKAVKPEGTKAWRIPGQAMKDFANLQYGS